VPSLPGTSSKKICRWNQGTRIRERCLDDTTQILTVGCRGFGFMFLEQAQSGADHFGFIIVTPTGNEPSYQAFEMGRYDFAHGFNTYQ
jgi:hypothetical protein